MCHAASHSQVVQRQSSFVFSGAGHCRPDGLLSRAIEISKPKHFETSPSRKTRVTSRPGGGREFGGVPDGSTRYVRREDLLALPQVSYTVRDDANFKGPTQVSGVSLGELARGFSANPQSDLIVATCDDLYRANYSRSYITAHDPLLVLFINGKAPEGWPRDSESHGMSMGPYLISHPVFASRSKVLSQSEEPQIPWGVIRLEFRSEERVFGAIAPRGPNAKEPAVQDGYHIAQQNCFRCGRPAF